VVIRGKILSSNASVISREAEMEVAEKDTSRTLGQTLPAAWHSDDAKFLNATFIIDISTAALRPLLHARKADLVPL
jgi:hypothetical protein